MLDVTEDAQDFIDEYGLTYPMLKDKDGHGIETFGVVQYPETFVIDRRGPHHGRAARPRGRASSCGQRWSRCYEARPRCSRSLALAAGARRRDGAGLPQDHAWPTSRTR